MKKNKLILRREEWSQINDLISIHLKKLEKETEGSKQKEEHNNVSRNLSNKPEK